MNDLTFSRCATSLEATWGNGFRRSAQG